MAYKLHTDVKAKSISYGGSRSASFIKYLVYHYTGNTTDSAKGNANYFHTSNTRQAGAHYFVDSTSVYQSIDDLKIAWAVGGSKYSDCGKTGGGKMYGKITNANSISIEICSDGGKFTKEALENAAELGKKLMKKYNIPVSNVYRHFDVTGKSCPGWSGWIGKDSHKWTEFKKKLGGSSAPKKTEPKKDTKPSGKKAYSGTFPSMTLSMCSTGIQVKYLQKFLNWYSPANKIPVDGNYGLKTKNAVKKFQKAQGLKDDGVFGANSLKKAKEVKK